LFSLIAAFFRFYTIQTESYSQANDVPEFNKDGRHQTSSIKGRKKDKFIWTEEIKLMFYFKQLEDRLGSKAFISSFLFYGYRLQTNKNREELSVFDTNKWIVFIQLNHFIRREWILLTHHLFNPLFF
jgi:hypothetical protein